MFTFAVLRSVSSFTASGALLLEQDRACDGRAKLGTAFSVMRLAILEWEAALHAKLTERASHLC